MVKRVRTALLLAALACMMTVVPTVLAGCEAPSAPPPVHKIELPEAAPRVYSLTLQCGGSDINGMLSADISLGEIKVTAKIRKDDGFTGEVVFSCDDPSVAEIASDGTITLKSAGECAVSAELGGKSASFVLSVGNSYTQKYTVTVVGGAASVTSAARGEIVTLSAAVIEHKRFVRWVYSDNVEWVNGHDFKMPSGDVTVSAEYVDILYPLRLVGATVVGDGGDDVQVGVAKGYEGEVQSAEYAITEYMYPFGTELTLQAAPTASGKMFVGWDKNEVNARLDVMDTELDFVTADDAMTTLWANYSSYTTKRIFYTPCKKFTGDAVSGVDDPEYGELRGYTLNIPGNTAACDAYDAQGFNGNLVDTLNNGTQLVEMIFHNRGEQDVTVEVYSHSGSMSSTGDVTVRAGEYVTEHFVVYPAMMASTNQKDEGYYWSFALKNDLGDGDVALDIVGGAADMYPKGDPLFDTAGGGYVTVENYTRVGETYGATWGNYMHDVNKPYNASTNNKYMGRFMDNTRGWVGIGASQQWALSNSGYLYAKITNLPAYDAKDPYIVINVKMLNSVNTNGRLAKKVAYTYDFALGTTQSPFDESGSRAELKLSSSEYGEIKQGTLVLRRDPLVTEYYLSLYKKQFDTEDRSKPSVVAGAPPLDSYRYGFSAVFSYGKSEVDA